MIILYLSKMFISHLRQDVVEVGLVLHVDETIMEDSQSFVAEETKDLLCLSHHTRVSLEDT